MHKNVKINEIFTLSTLIPTPKLRKEKSITLGVIPFLPLHLFNMKKYTNKKNHGIFIFVSLTCFT